MTFPTVLFGKGAITGTGALNYIDGDTISSGGFRLFIVPTKNLGGAGIDIGFTYVNQFGVTKTTSVTTAVAPNTTAGTHVQVVLEPGDTGIRDIIDVSAFIGGSAGDQLNFESWNEGLGRPPYDISKTEPFDRSAPGAYFPEPYLGLWKGIDYPYSSVIPVSWYEDPQIPVPIQVLENRSLIVEWSPELEIDRVIPVKAWNLADSLGNRKGIVEWITEPLSKRDFAGKSFSVFRSWLESVVGQVLSGYIRNVDEQVIKNAFSMILMSTTPTEISPGGTSTTADVNPDTGLYQAFLKKVIYDKRYVIIKVGIKNIALEGAGIPEVIDGYQQLPIPYDLQFACPVKNCDFTVTRKIGGP